MLDPFTNVQPAVSVRSGTRLTTMGESRVPVPVCACACARVRVRVRVRARACVRSRGRRSPRGFVVGTRSLCFDRPSALAERLAPEPFVRPRIRHPSEVEVATPS